MHQTKKRVLITGLGPVAPNGIGKNEYWEALKMGRSGINRITRFPVDDFAFKMAGEVNRFLPEEYLEKKFIMRTDRSTHLAAASIMLALEDANMNLSKENLSGVDLYIGTALGGMEKYSANYLQFLSTNKKRMSAYAAVNSFGDSCSGSLAALLGIRGYVGTVNFACASGTQSVIEAYRKIIFGESELVISCGVDTPLLEEIMFAFYSAAALSRKDKATPAPFSIGRDGLVLGEGAGAIIVEEMSHALARNAHVYAEVLGYGNSTDAASIAIGDESGGGKKVAILKAFESAGVTADEIDYVSAHGPGTVKGDRIEAEVINSIFGERGRSIPVSSAKSMIGHTQGAGGSLEIIAGLMAIEKSVIHPTINYQGKDMQCDINCVPNEALIQKVDVLMKESFGFGGKNAVLILRRFCE